MAQASNEATREASGTRGQWRWSTQGRSDRATTRSTEARPVDVPVRPTLPASRVCGGNAGRSSAAPTCRAARLARHPACAATDCPAASYPASLPTRPEPGTGSRSPGSHTGPRAPPSQTCARHAQRIVVLQSNG
jgi:hypothetical protein